MQLAKELLEMAATNPKFLLIFCNDNHEAYDFAAEILGKFGYKDVGSCVDIQESEYWKDEYTNQIHLMNHLEDIGIWAKNDGPSEAQVINALRASDVCIFEDE